MFGAIVCRSNALQTYYPISLFDTENGLCDLNETFPLNLLESAYVSINTLIGEIELQATVKCIIDIS